MNKETQQYQKLFEAREKQFKAIPWLYDIQKKAMEDFEKIGFPNSRSEAWRYTNLRKLAETQFQEAPLTSLTPSSLMPLVFQPANRLVFINGHFHKELSMIQELPAIVTNLSEALKQYPDLVKAHLGQHINHQEHPFSALNSAFIHDGAFLKIPENVVLQDPIHLLYISTAKDKATASFPRNLIVMEESSEAQIIESYYGLGHLDCYFNNIVTEISIAKNAKLDYCKIENESRSAFHISMTHARLYRDSIFRNLSFDIGGLLVRNDLHVRMEDSGSDCSLNGLYAVKDNQHVDNLTNINHIKANTSSRELYKGILEGNSKGIFNGKIKVYQDAQKTNASQTNKNLLLSDNYRWLYRNPHRQNRS